MPSPDERNVTVVVIELKPGLIYVKFVEPKPEPDRIELLLHCKIEHWFNDHPQYVIEQARAVTEHGTVQGIYVWYHAIGRQVEPVDAEPPHQPNSLSFEVDDQIDRRFTTEYIEAVVGEAIGLVRSHQEPCGTLVVINPRGIAVVLDAEVNRIAVLPIDAVDPAIDDVTKARVRNWLEAPTTRWHLIRITGSWFRPSKTGSRSSKIVDPGFLHTNMTYDAGPGPKT